MDSNPVLHWTDHAGERQAWPLTKLQKEFEAFLAWRAQQPAASGEPVTLADVLDALNLFNRPKPSEDDGPWEGGHFIRVDHLPDFINIIAAAWFSPQPAPARVPPGWQPIETAPADMGAYLFRVNGIAAQGFKDAAGIMCVQNERHEWRKMRGKPTHWMPLPTAPGAPDAQPTKAQER